MLLIATVLSSVIAATPPSKCPGVPVFAKNPTTETIVEFPSPCDVPTSWVVVTDEEADWKNIKTTASKYYNSSSKYVSGVWHESKEDRSNAVIYLKDSVSDVKSTVKTKFNAAVSDESISAAKDTATEAWGSFKGMFNSFSEDKNDK